MSIHLAATATLPTEVGTFDIQIRADTVSKKEHIVLKVGDMKTTKVLMRVHSSCITGECFLSKKCDCGPQLHTAMSRIQQEGAGCIIYLDQEGRDIGLINKIKAYALQDNGLDTVEANKSLGLPIDGRTYEVVKHITDELGIVSCRLLTNNPAKVDALSILGVEIVERVPLLIDPTAESREYFHTKQQKMGHLFTHLTGSDVYYMNEAIEQAKLCKNTLPNPRVGAVIVKEGEIVGRGYTQKYGDNHAEIEALDDAGDKAQGATLYVTLEPCSHHGKTPPCADAIIAAGIDRVVCAKGVDPNSKVFGKGIAILKDAGLEVLTGVLEDQATKINKDIDCYYEKKRPYIAAKCALSLDGKIATKSGDSKWITTEASRVYTRLLRTKYQAILVGKGTVLADDPHLGSRQEGYVDPLRIILDSTLQTSPDAQVYRDDNVLVATTDKAPIERQQLFRDRGISLLVLAGERVDLKLLMDVLYARHVTGILVEGGAEVLGSFFDEQFVDELYIVHAPIIIGGANAPGAIGGIGIDSMSNTMRLVDIERTEIDADMHTRGRVVYTK